MKAFEFQSRLGPEGTLVVPADLRHHVGPEQQVRVLMLVSESEDDSEWNRLTTEQFLKGYDASDALYDDLQAR